MINVGITGQAGFVGTNLFNYLKLQDQFHVIPFEDSYYDNLEKLKQFTSECDVIVHLAAVMRNQESGYVYNTNMRLVNDLVNAADAAGAKPSFLFASSIQETGDSEYARCKRDGAEVLSLWCKNKGKGFCKMIFPNLFGPYAKPNYSSFVATFCYKLTHGEKPQIIVDNEVPLIFIGDLVPLISIEIKNVYETEDNYDKIFKPQCYMKVSEVLDILSIQKKKYIDNRQLPKYKSEIEKQLFTTMCSYITK